MFIRIYIYTYIQAVPWFGGKNPPKVFQFDGHVLGDMLWWPTHGFSPKKIWAKSARSMDPTRLFSGGDEGRKHRKKWRFFGTQRCPKLKSHLKSTGNRTKTCCEKRSSRTRGSDFGPVVSFCPVWIWGGSGYRNFISHTRETRSEDKTYPERSRFVSRQLSRLWERPAFIDLETYYCNTTRTPLLPPSRKSDFKTHPPSHLVADDFLCLHGSFWHFWFFGIQD